VRRRVAAGRSIVAILFLALAAASATAPASAQNGEGPGGPGRASAPTGPDIGRALRSSLREPLKDLGASWRWLDRHALHPTSRAATRFFKEAGEKIAAPFRWAGAHPRVAAADQDRAREAMRAGQIVPLANVLKTVQTTVPGDVLKVSLDRTVVGTWNYQITVLTPQGYYRDVDVDAGDNRITEIKAH